MNNKFSRNLSTNLNTALLDVLKNRITTDQRFNDHLEDIVNLLMDALNRGELFVNLKNIPKSIKIKGSGWPDEHIKILIESGWIGKEISPIIQEGQYISWRRWNIEANKIFNSLKEKSSLKPRLEKNDNIEIKYLIPKTLNNEQIKAINAIKKENLILLNGGPGTGKTSTISQIILKGLSINPEIRIGLAAPTGKATKKLQDTLRIGIEFLGEEENYKLSKIPCKTLHKWLFTSEKFKEENNKKLNIDILIIDEMSMVDLELMKRVLESLPIESQLILVGDRNQLPPVGSGDIWYQLLEDKNGQIPKNSKISLVKTYRNRGDIATLARSIKDEETSIFLNKLLSLNSSSNVKTHRIYTPKIPSILLENINPHKEQLKYLTKKLFTSLRIEIKQSSEQEIDISKESEDVFKCIERLMILSPQRHGSWGVNHIHKVLLGNQFTEGIRYWPLGTPVLCGENQPEIGLANGDVGIVIPFNEGKRVLFNVFSKKEKRVTRLIHPSRIKKLEPAYATTVHKAQGSESEHVILLWPNPTDPISTGTKDCKIDKSYEKRLIYTAITRAKNKLDIVMNQRE